MERFVHSSKKHHTNAANTPIHACNFVIRSSFIKKTVSTKKQNTCAPFLVQLLTISTCPVSKNQNNFISLLLALAVSSPFWWDKYVIKINHMIVAANATWNLPFFITVQSPHSYDAKIHENRLRRWDFRTSESYSYGLSSKCFDLLWIVVPTTKQAPVSEVFPQSRTLILWHFTHACNSGFGLSTGYLTVLVILQ